MQAAHYLPQALTLVAITAIIVFAVVVVPKLGSTTDGFRNVVIIFFANFQVRNCVLPAAAALCQQSKPHRWRGCQPAACGCSVVHSPQEHPMLLGC